MQLEHAVFVFDPEFAFCFTGDGAHKPHHFFCQKNEMQRSFLGKAFERGSFFRLLKRFLDLIMPAGNRDHIRFHILAPYRLFDRPAFRLAERTGTNFVLKYTLISNVFQ